MARYKRSHADSGVSLERETERVSADGRYHVMRGDVVVSSHRTLKAGATAYLKLLNELGVSTKTPAPTAKPATEEVEAGSPRLFGDYYVYGKSRRRKTETRTYG